MAVFRAQVPFDMNASDAPAGEITQASGSSLTVEAEGYRDIYYGVFEFIQVDETTAVATGPLSAVVSFVDGLVATEFRQLDARIDEPALYGPVAGVYRYLLRDDDRLFGSNGADLLNGFGGDDVVKGRGGDDRLVGRAGEDALIGGRGDDRLNGGGGADRLIGGAGDDVLKGQAGDDILIGGRGDDRLTGGRGADRFEFGAREGRDVIFDFGEGRDLLVIGRGAASFGDLEISDAPRGARISFAQTEILLLDVEAADLDARDFLFG